MRFDFAPQRRDEAQPTLAVAGDVLTVNGEAFDFSPLADGDILDAEAVACEYIIGGVTRQGGEVIVRLVLPHGPNAPHETLFPEPITVASGQVTLPPYNQEANL